MKQGEVTKVLSPDETAKVLVETVSILNAVTSTTGLLHNTLMRFRERGVRFVLGDAITSDAETDRAFDEVCEVLRLMKEGIPQRVASALLEGEATPQNAPSVNTIH
jgi:hypothetical protein